ncbi:MAG: hypothetical protein A2X08_04330 [Bacteroidetes bacterium GWA2_32_17]|nr:MAG: hypothetical protein A2X08_04330 [Bacteroidetes bacterium GWA2_32_17]
MKTIIFSLLFLLIIQQNIVKSQSYNPDASAAYSDQWWDVDQYTYNTQYDYYIGNDCANFASQCLIAGGLNLSVGINENLPQGTGPGQNGVDAFGAIPFCDNLHLHLLNHQNTQYQRMNNPNEPAWIFKGDVGIFGSTSDYWQHAVFAVVGDVSTTTLYNAHTTNRWHKEVSWFYSQWSSGDFYHIIPLTALFNADITNGSSPLTVHFTDISTGGATNWNWSFPGGTPATSTLQNPDVIYNNSGLYSVTLTVTNDFNGSDTKTINNYINVNNLLTANFLATPTTIATGGTVAFTDQSTGTPTSWSWSFPGGTPSSYNGQTPPAITYNTDGNYNVSLTVTNTGGSSTETKTNYITVSDLLHAAFSVSPTSVYVGSNVNFNDESSGSPTDWEWSISPSTGFDYVNVTSNNSQNPVVRFNYAGSYLINLNVIKGTDQNSTNVNGNGVSIYVNEAINIPNFDIYWQPSLPNNSDVITFHTSGYIPLAYDYLWDFGDGTGSSWSTLQDPTYSYSFEGVYTVTLTITDVFNNCSYQKTKTITITQPDLDLGYIDWTTECYIVPKGYPVEFYDLSTYFYDQFVIRQWTFGFQGSDYYQTDKYFLAQDTYKPPFNVTHTFHYQAINNNYLRWEDDDENVMGGCTNTGDGACDKWGGVYVVDCDHTSTYVPYFNEFPTALYQYSPHMNYFYSGSFLINSSSNNYINSQNIAFEACKEIILDDGFETDGTHEFIAEIISNSCFDNFLSGKSAEIVEKKFTVKNETNEEEPQITDRISINPNPVNGSLNLFFVSNDDNVYKIEIYSNNTLLLFQEDWSVNYGLNEIKIPFEYYAKGIYILRLYNTKENFSIKFNKN